MTFSRLLLVDDATDVRIAGRGTIAGNGPRCCGPGYGAVPNLVRVRRSRQRVDRGRPPARRRGLDAAPARVRGRLHARTCRILNDRDVLNTDGIDPDMSSDVADRPRLHLHEGRRDLRQGDGQRRPRTATSGTSLVTRCVRQLARRRRSRWAPSPMRRPRSRTSRFEDCTRASTPGARDVRRRARRRDLRADRVPADPRRPRVWTTSSSR